MTDRTYPTIELASKLYQHREYLYVTSTTSGQHAVGSYHYKGEAVDFGSGLDQVSKHWITVDSVSRWDAMDGFASWWYWMSVHITELIHTNQQGGAGWYVKNYIRKPYGFFGTAVDEEHVNHVHVAISNYRAAGTLLVVAFQRATGLVADGIQGPKTNSIIREIQTAGHITVDGSLGPLTVEATRRHLGWRDC